MIVVTIFCVLLGVFMWSLRESIKQDHLKQLCYNFKQLAIALHIYSDVFAQFPVTNSNGPPSKPINSWRFQIAPFIEMVNPYDGGDFSAAWDDPITLHNYYQKECFYRVSDRGEGGSSKETIVLAITGPGTAFEDGKTYKPEELPDDLIIVVETRNSGLLWMEPGDLDIRTMPRTINAPDGRGIAANIGRRFHVIFADGSVWQLSTDVPFEDVEKFLTIDGAKQHGRNEVLGPYVTRK